MVDPNRKINRLTDKDIEFLDECEEEFGTRYTEEDSDFMEHCAKPLSDPPIVDNWGYGGAGHSGNQRNHYGGAGRNQRWNRRGGGGGGGGPDRGPGSYGGYRRGKPYDRRDDRRHDNRETDRSDHPPMNIRRDYGNFVAASKD